MGPLPYPPLSHKIDLTLAQGRWREKNGDQENNPPLKGGGLLLPSNNLPFLTCIFCGILQQWLVLGGQEKQSIMGKNLRLDFDWLDWNKIKRTNLSFGRCINYFFLMQLLFNLGIIRKGLRKTNNNPLLMTSFFWRVFFVVFLNNDMLWEDKVDSNLW